MINFLRDIYHSSNMNKRLSSFQLSTKVFQPYKRFLDSGKEESKTSETERLLSTDLDISPEASPTQNFCSRQELDPVLRDIGDSLHSSFFYSPQFLTLPSKQKGLFSQVQDRTASIVQRIVDFNWESPTADAKHVIAVLTINFLNAIGGAVDELYWDNEKTKLETKGFFYGLEFSLPNFGTKLVHRADFAAIKSETSEEGPPINLVRMVGNVDICSVQLPLLRSAADACRIMALDGLRAVWAINVEGPHHVRIVCFHAAGAIATERIDIKTSVHRLIQALICLFVKDSIQAGLDPTMTRNHVLTPFGRYRIDQSFFESPSYIGKGIRVCKLKADQDRLKRDVQNSSQYLVMKKAWTPEHATETKAINSIVKQSQGTSVFGLATWIQAEVLSLSSPRTNSTLKKIASNSPFKKHILCTEDDTGFFSNNLKKKQLTRLPFYSPQDAQYVVSAPLRTLNNVRYFSLTCGAPLSNAEGFQQLTEAILHAAIGHYKLYEMGWVHRDVSTGNVLLVQGENTRQRPFGSLSTSPFKKLTQLGVLTNCKAFLNDLDLAHPYQSDKRVFQCKVVGTRPYLSQRLIEMRARKTGRFLVQNSVDDLESFLWLLMHLVYKKQRHRSIFTTLDREMLSHFDHTCSDKKMALHKKALSEFHRNSLNMNEPSAVLPLKKLFRTLLVFFATQRSKLIGIISSSNCWDELQALAIETYQNFFRELLQVLPDLPNNWDIQ